MQNVNVEYLRDLISRKKKTARQISIEAGLNETAIRDILSGKSKIARPHTIYKIAHTIGVSPLHLMDLSWFRNEFSGNESKMLQWVKDLNFDFNSITETTEDGLLKWKEFLTREEFNNSVTRTTQRFENKSSDFSNSSLSGANMKGVNLTKANFQNAFLAGADFSSAYLYGADFRNANLMDANLSDSNLEGADFRGACLDNTQFSGANLQRANFSKDEPKSEKVGISPNRND